jgi:hypothetical protein
LGILTINAIRAASEVIIPVEASRFSLEGLTQLIDIINLVRDRLNHNVEHKILVSNFDSRLRHSFKILDHIKTTYRNRLFGNIIHVNVKLKEAQSQGLHVYSYDKYCRGAKDYYSLSREIISQEARPAEDKMPVIKEKMKAIIKEKMPALKEVAFAIRAPQAKEVYVAGDFNNWTLNENSRMNQDDGTWNKRIGLPSGRYHYRFVIDGVWTDDPGNPKKEKNPFGDTNSLVEVSAR